MEKSEDKMMMSKGWSRCELGVSWEGVTSGLLLQLR